ncbi:steroid 5-alpha reductase family enzyme [Microbacterium endophyticum]|uniref:Steroid 5-alpha reductase family enzyme n=1 Tax=Microbacterium endophyticum TaxID=1526412 RepID=A0A7W4V1H7_9MICO|nr:DUF1295 domain-containing protein [Microbacterium endophyticum]MBB2975148.1 steroid 5-alpha reductase family enzyme [Microbacterium endophyticum]NIK37312.1 steroid 5-alpha reductase family enzyme [Microbacterium endophyticum]
MTPLSFVLVVAAAVSFACWVLSLVTKDTSWVDRIWSIVPVAYVWIFASASLTAGADSARLLIMAALVTLWGARLTVNFARKGGYSGMEDYRWAILRARMKTWQFQLFNLFFIVLYQNALLVLIALPALVAWQNPAPLTWWDALWSLCFLGFLIGEYVADQQQWTFHKAKQSAGGALAPGFATGGLFKFSRHPNFFFEQAQWWAFYFLGATAATSLGWWGGVINWTIVGAALLTVLFIGSTIFTESISAGKYPEYADYQRTTSMLFPWPPRMMAQTASRPPDSVR